MGSVNFAAPFELLKPVDVDPAKYATQYANLAALAQMRQYRQAEMANQQQEMAVRQADLQQKQTAIDQTRAVNQAYMDAFEPDQNGVPQLNRDKFTAALTKAGHGSAIPAIHKDWEEYDKSHAALQEANTNLAKAQTDHLGNIGAVLKTANFDPHLALTLIQDGAHKGTVDETQGQQLVNEITSRMAQDPTGESARAYIQPIAEQMIQNSPTQQALAKTVQETQTAKAAQAKSETETAGLQTANQIKAYELKVLTDVQQSPGKGSDAIDTIFPPDKYGTLNTKFKAAYNSAGTGMADVNQIATAKQGVIKMALDAAKEIAPETIQAAADKAVAEAKATLPLKIEQAVGEAKATQPLKIEQAVATAKAMSGTGPTANVPPHLGPVAIAGYNKSIQSLASAQTATDSIQTVLDAAAAGNKAAGANVPLVGVGALNAVNGIKRINSAEIAQYGTAGSLLDKIQGKLQGWTEGQPVPKDVLDDMKSLHSQLSEGAQTKHQREVEGINKAYGSTFEPMKFQPKAASGLTPIPQAVQNVLKNATPGIHTLSDGTTWIKNRDGSIQKQ